MSGLAESLAAQPIADVPFTAPARCLIGRNAKAQVADAVNAMGHRVFVLRSASVAWADVFIAELQTRGLNVTTQIARGEPTADQVREAVTQARASDADCIVAIGGGAVIDLGKAVSGLCVSEGDVLDHLGLGSDPASKLNDPLPFVAVPTTSGTGAEATRNAVIGVPEQGLKISLRDPRLVPDLAVVDASLTDGLPKHLTLSTGLDALTQLIESYLSNRANPITDALVRGMIAPAAEALRHLMTQEDQTARDTMAKASYISGLALANSGLGVVHGLAAVIGSQGGAHGAICGRLLPAALTVNRGAMVNAGLSVTRLDEVDGWLRDGLGQSLQAFIDAEGLASLTELKCGPSLWSEMAERARTASSTQANPVRLSASEIERILELADAADH
ncbi:iron-containing alcohol dehydrogenase [Celeribacter sp. PS-C1]|uniref:iron-containing alcohol dehydrogenase n=1 Tax=Celeribacter sp. PS-C1 TaxID=2820813 RepID=UPI001CA58AFC|nr:iron-containing alcohol dehydrogenase [Celeribacter sp. PS-C1]MBW6419257.1 iron-containing alcohol dehydrogenase [Celeribacter sp. PS-C1]